jgi:hypothetical protein
MSKTKFLKLHRGSALLLTLLLCGEPLFGTCISVVILPAGIVMAADGKTIAYLANKRVPPKGVVSKKLRLLHRRMLLGAYGLAKIGDDPHPAYYLGSFFDRVEKEVSKTATVSEVAQKIGEDATEAMSGITQVLAGGTLTRDALIQQTGRDNPLAGFVIAGYEFGSPKLFRITLEIDWSTGRLRPAIVALIYPPPPGMPQTNIFSSDTTNASLIPSWTACRVPKGGIPLHNIEIMARAIVDLDIEINGANVGLPITTVTLLPDGGYRIARFQTRLPNLCEAQSQKKHGQ